MRIKSSSDGSSNTAARDDETSDDNAGATDAHNLAPDKKPSEEGSKSANGAEPKTEPTAKIKPPSPEEQSRLKSKIEAIYGSAMRSDSAATLAVAQKMLDDARKSEFNRAEQFVLMRCAAETARDAGDVQTALNAVDAMDSAGFDIRPCAVKMRMVAQIVGQMPAADANRVSEVSGACVSLAREAQKNGAGGEAAELLDAAQRKTGLAIEHADKLARSLKGKVGRLAPRPITPKPLLTLKTRRASSKRSK